MEINKSTETIIKEEKNLENGIKTLIIPKNLLQENCRLQYIIGNGFNDFFRIKGANKAFMHVNNGRCVITDYKATTYNSGEECIIPVMLSVYRYNSYQKWQNMQCREWVKRTDGSNITVSMDIIRIIKGYTREQAKADGYTLHHRTETYKETLRDLEYCVDKERDSHRRRYIVENQAQLDYLIDLIIEDDQIEESRFLDDDK